MSQYKRRDSEDEDEIGMVYRRPRRREPDAERKGVSRFPALPDGSPALGFATLTHGNLKSWAKLASAQGHNTRTIDTPNARPTAPEPIELLEGVTGSYTDRVKSVLDAHNVPVRIRKGGTIATEDIYGASPEYWNRDGDWKLKPVAEIVRDPVIQAAVALAKRKHGKMLISCSLHVDEESPHLHVVAVPLVKRFHAKRGPKPKSSPIGLDGKKIDQRPMVEKYSLDVTSERGTSKQLESNHDAWADACSTFGLVRGERGSEMTKEERRARRNRSTGRASMAEKVAREEREALLKAATIEAEQILEKARAEAEDAKKVAAAAAEEAAAMKQAQQDREAQLSAELAAATNDRMEAALERAKAKKARWDAEAAEAKLIDHVTDVIQIVSPESVNKPCIEDGEVYVQGPHAAEIIAKFTALPKAVRDVAHAVLRHAAVTRIAEVKCQEKSGQLSAAQSVVDSERDAIRSAHSRAIEFKNAWSAIPAEQRSPDVQRALNATQGLTLEDLPPGFSLPGKGGLGMG